MEYTIAPTNTAPQSGWQIETFFDGLSENTTYFIFARSVENQNYHAGAPSEPLEVRTGETGINIPQTTVVEIYPNPVSDKLYVTHSIQGEADYTVYTADGRNVMQGKIVSGSSINVVPLATGIYYLDVGGKMIRFVRKL